jgi:DHA1 family bicyclomycin/chloramphenicol resistance-like MFS transporter
MLEARSLATTLAIAALVALGPLSTDMYLPALPTLARAFDTDSGRVQLTLSLFLAGFAIAQLVLGPLSDRFGRKPVLMGGLGLFLLSSIGCALASHIETLILFRFLQALGGSAGPVLGRAMVRDIHGPDEAGRILSHIGSAMALGPAVAPIVGGYLLILLGWASIFWFLALFSLFAIWLLHYRIGETAPAQSRHPRSLSRIVADFGLLLRDRHYLGYTLACSFSFAGLFVFLSVSSFVIIDYFGYPPERFGLWFLMVVTGYLTGTLGGGRLSRVLGHRKLVAAGTVICLASGTVMALVGFNEPRHALQLMLPMLGFMIGVGIVMPQSMAGALADYPRIAGSASGLMGFIQMTLAGGIGVLAGHLHDGTPAVMSGMIAVCGLLSFVSAWGLTRR